MSSPLRPFRCRMTIQTVNYYPFVNPRYPPPLPFSLVLPLPNGLALMCFTLIMHNIYLNHCHWLYLYHYLVCVCVCVFPLLIAHSTLLAFLYICRTFPWGCVGGLLRRLVPDASPHGLPSTATTSCSSSNNNNNNISKNSIISSTSAADMAALDAQLSSVSSVALPSKSPSMLIQRTPSLGERVL